jgi:hypothetical protein
MAHLPQGNQTASAHLLRRRTYCRLAFLHERTQGKVHRANIVGLATWIHAAVLATESAIPMYRSLGICRVLLILHAART